MDIAIISLIIMGICIVLFIWNKIPSATVALMGVTAMIIFKVCTPAEALWAFSSNLFILVLGMLILGLALFSSGAASVIGNYAIKFSRNKERRFIFISCCISAILSAFLTNTAVIAMMMAICAAATASSKDMKLKNLLIPVAIASIFGGHCTLVGSTTQLTASGLLFDATGLSFGMWDLMWVCFPATIFIILYMTFIGYPIGKKIWGKTLDVNSDNKMDEIQVDTKLTKLTKEGKIVISIFILVIFLFITNWIPTGATAMIGAILCIITGTISQKEVFLKLDWNVLLWLCSVLGLGKALNVGGGANIISDFLLQTVDASTSPFLFFAVSVLIVMIMSELMSNMATLIIIMPGILSLVITLGLSPYAFSYGMCLGAALTFLTPLANGHIGMTMTGGYKYSDYVIYGLAPTIVTYLIIIFLTPVFFPLMI